MNRCKPGSERPDNSAIALPVWMMLRSLHSQTIQAHWLVALGLTEIVLLAGARDTLKKYYSRTNEILSDRSQSIIIGPG